jgi:hypothetical protein
MLPSSVREFMNIQLIMKSIAEKLDPLLPRESGFFGVQKTSIQYGQRKNPGEESFRLEWLRTQVGENIGSEIQEDLGDSVQFYPPAKRYEANFKLTYNGLMNESLYRFIDCVTMLQHDPITICPVIDIKVITSEFIRSLLLNQTAEIKILNMAFEMSSDRNEQHLAIEILYRGVSHSGKFLRNHKKVQRSQVDAYAK